MESRQRNSLWEKKKYFLVKIFFIFSSTGEVSPGFDFKGGSASALAGEYGSFRLFMRSVLSTHGALLLSLLGLVS